MKLLKSMHKITREIAKAGVITCTLLTVVFGGGAIGCWGLSELISVNCSQKFILSKKDWDKNKEFCLQGLIPSLVYLMLCVMFMVYIEAIELEQTASELADEISLNLHECHSKIKQLIYLQPEFRDCLNNMADDVLLGIKTLESLKDSVILPSDIEKPLSILKEMGILKSYQAGKKQLVLTFYNGDCQSFQYSLYDTCELLRYIANLQMNLAAIDDLALRNQESEFRNHNSPKIRKQR